MTDSDRPSPDRRAFLSTVAGLGLGGSLGRARGTGATDPERLQAATSEWPAAGHDSANTGFGRDADSVEDRIQQASIVQLDGSGIGGLAVRSHSPRVLLAVTEAGLWSVSEGSVTALTSEASARASTPIYIESPSSTVLFRDRRRRLVAFDGAVTTAADVDRQFVNSPVAGVPSPGTDSRLVYCGTAGGELVALRYDGQFEVAGAAGQFQAPVTGIAVRRAGEYAGRVVGMDMEGRVRAYDPTLDQQLWTRELDARGPEAPAQVTIYDDTVFAHTGGRQLAAYSLFDGTVRWSESDSDIEGGFVSVGAENVFIGSPAGVSAFDRQSGEKGVVMRRHGTYGAPTITEDRLYVTTRDQRVMAITRDGSVVWEFWPTVPARTRPIHTGRAVHFMRVDGSVSTIVTGNRTIGTTDYLLPPVDMNFGTGYLPVSQEQVAYGGGGVLASLAGISVVRRIRSGGADDDADRRRRRSRDSTDSGRDATDTTADSGTETDSRQDASTNDESGAASATGTAADADGITDTFDALRELPDEIARTPLSAVESEAIGWRSTIRTARRADTENLPPTITAEEFSDAIAAALTAFEEKETLVERTEAYFAELGDLARPLAAGLNAYSRSNRTVARVRLGRVTDALDEASELADSELQDVDLDDEAVQRAFSDGPYAVVADNVPEELGVIPGIDDDALAALYEHDIGSIEDLMAYPVGEPWPTLPEVDEDLDRRLEAVRYLPADPSTGYTVSELRDLPTDRIEAFHQDVL